MKPYYTRGTDIYEAYCKTREAESPGYGDIHLAEILRDMLTDIRAMIEEYSDPYDDIDLETLCAESRIVFNHLNRKCLDPDDTFEGEPEA